jgi:hypothetical protein
MKNLSRFDIIMIVAFLSVALIGGGLAYYLDAFMLAAAHDDVQAADQEFEQYSTQMVFLPTRENLKILQGNIDLINSQIDPVVKGSLQATGNTLADQHNENTVVWKRRLDDRVAKLNAAARTAGVQVPQNYYYGFSSYLSQAPAETNTGVLSKQLLAIEQLTGVMVSAQVNAIKAIRRTAEEGGPGPSAYGGTAGDFITGHSAAVSGGLYINYPFEIEFDATTDTMRKVINGLMQTPCVFIIRGLSVVNSAVENAQAVSPQVTSLDTLAGPQTPAPSVTDSPGAVAAAKSTAGPQYLFGNEFLHVRMRVDLIEWKGLPDATAAVKPAGKAAAPTPSPTGT